MFPVKHDGGTTRERHMATRFHFGFLVGEGHFGGAGRQPHVTLRIHERHEAIFDWLQPPFRAAGSTGRITTAGVTTSSGWHGPSCAANWCLCSTGFPSPDLDRYSFDRYQLMKQRYPLLAAGPDAPVLPPDRPRRTEPQRTGPVRPRTPVTGQTYPPNSARSGRPEPGHHRREGSRPPGKVTTGGTATPTAVRPEGSSP
jgi:hypothetical protein